MGKLLVTLLASCLAPRNYDLRGIWVSAGVRQAGAGNVDKWLPLSKLSFLIHTLSGVTAESAPLRWEDSPVKCLAHRWCLSHVHRVQINREH